MVQLHGIVVGECKTAEGKPAWAVDCRGDGNCIAVPIEWISLERFKHRAISLTIRPNLELGGFDYRLYRHKEITEL